MSSPGQTQGVIDLTFLDMRNESDLSAQLAERVPAASAVSAAATAKASATTANAATNPNANSLSTKKDSPKSAKGEAASAGAAQTHTLTHTHTQARTSPLRSRPSSEIKALRLSNNLFARMESLQVTASHLNTQNILWLDLSFNSFSSILEDLSRLFPHLTTLHLHANKISRLSEIKHLTPCEELKSLSLFGNPVEENKHYRNYVLFNCKHLTQFDKSPVTKSQRDKMEVWAQTFRKKLNPDPDEE